MCFVRELSFLFICDCVNDMACQPSCQGTREPVSEAVRAPGGLSGRLSGRQRACRVGCQDTRGPVGKTVRAQGSLSGRLSGRQRACQGGFQGARGLVWEAVSRQLHGFHCIYGQAARLTKL